MPRVLALVEHDLYGHALDNFYIVAGGVFRRQQAEARARRGGDALDAPGERAAATCEGPVSAVRSSARACCSAARAWTRRLSATRMPASASAICDWAESAAAFCAVAAASVASNCWRDTSSLASRPRSRSTSREAFVALTSTSRWRASAVVSRA